MCYNLPQDVVQLTSRCVTTYREMCYNLTHMRYNFDLNIFKFQTQEKGLDEEKCYIIMFSPRDNNIHTHLNAHLHDPTYIIQLQLTVKLTQNI